MLYDNLTCPLLLAQGNTSDQQVLGHFFGSTVWLFRAPQLALDAEQQTQIVRFYKSPVKVVCLHFSI